MKVMFNRINSYSYNVFLNPYIDMNNEMPSHNILSNTMSLDIIINLVDKGNFNPDSVILGLIKSINDI